MSTSDENQFPLLAYMDNQVELIRTLAPKALKDFDQEAIHQSRVATRRLKASLDLLRPALHDRYFEPVSNAGKKLRRRLGPLRDLDVLIDHLGSMSRLKKLAPAIGWLKGYLETCRKDVREETSAGKSIAAKTLACLGAWWGLREEIHEHRPAVQTLLGEAVHLQLDRFSEQADWLVTGQPPAGHDGSPQDPHEVRIAGKALRYMLEMAQEETGKLPGGVFKNFKKMQEQLGTWHDYVVLVEWTMKASVERFLPLHDAPLQLLMLDLSKLAMTRASVSLKSFATLWQVQGSDLTKTIRDAFPLTRDVAEQPAGATSAA